ncbi:sensor histidine kinase [Aeromicrobium sp.]|uniref:sensor histidine kinase n=1 Tax=Aeromicrobium sp. TaxID=1871063 RepID=UPI002FC65E37
MSLTARIRAWTDRSPRKVDAVLATSAFLVSVLVGLRDNGNAELRAPWDIAPLAWVVFAVAAVALLRRREHGALVFTVALACSAVLLLAQPDGQIGFAFLVSLYSAGRYAEGRAATIAVPAAAMAFAAIDAVTAESPVSDVIGGALVVFFIWYVGRRVRHRGERSVLVAREQEAQENRVLAEERARIARELHDVVAHGVSLMTVQAGAAKTVAVADPESAVQAMAAVEQTGREALSELRHLLAVLRPDSSIGELGPQPGLAGVERLVAQFREAGLAVSLDLDPVPASLPARVDLFAYRIVQEALTNVLKHAGPGTAAEVQVRIGPRVVTLEVSDDGRGATLLPGSGHGLVGMRERVQLLGGSLQAAARPDGGFRVHAVLPLSEESV